MAIEDDEIGPERNWDQLTNILITAAKQTCGTQGKRVENPWIIGAEEELEQLKKNINKWVRAGNNAKENNNAVALRVFEKKLAKSRKDMKTKLRSLEREWWDVKLQECEEAATKGDFGTVYSLLRQLGARTSKPLEGTMITSEQFQEYFAKISALWFESEPADLMAAAQTARDLTNDLQASTAAESLNEIPSFSEISEATEEVKDSAPGADKVRIRYITEATAEIRINVMDLVQIMFTTRADLWKQSVKKG